VSDETLDDPLDDTVASRAWDAGLARRLLAYVRPHWGLFATSFLVLAALFALDVFGPWIWKHELDGPLSAAGAARSVDPAADVSGHVREFWIWIVVYAGVVLLSLLLRYLEVAQLNRTGQAVIADLREQLFRHMQRLDLAFFDQRPTGQLVTRVTTDVENLNEMFTSGIVVLLFDTVKVVFLAGILFWIDVRLALVVCAGTPFLIGVSLVFRGGARRAHRLVRSRLARLNGYLQEMLQGIRVVQVFRREERVSRRFAGLVDSYFLANRQTIFLFALFFPTIDFVVSIVQGSTLWIGGEAIWHGRLSYGEFFQFWIYLAMLVAPIRELGERYNVLQSAFASAERVFQILDTRPTLAPPTLVPAPPRDGNPAATREPMRGHVRFEDVSFAYLRGSEVLSGVSFGIRPGETVAVVGATGAGKSTLVSLLLRFYAPTAGRITIDDVELRDYDETTLRRSIGLVMQEDFLFAGTIHENLVMEREDVTEESLELALEASRADELIAKLPGGLQAPVAERGAAFSTGERQLLAIARALAGDPRIVILDEATASVDSNTEAQIEAATRKLLEGRSALVVAHRLSTVRRASRILVMHKGMLREQGTHEELMALNGIYARLHALQFSEEEPAEAGRPG